MHTPKQATCPDLCDGQEGRGIRAAFRLWAMAAYVRGLPAQPLELSIAVRRAALEIWRAS